MKLANIKTLSIVLVLLAGFSFIFFDILFLNKSIQPSNVSGISWRPSDYQQDTWLTGSKMTHIGFRDVGSSYLQSEPARHFTARSFKNGESILWNPYSAAGTTGPEQLVDLKFSPINLLSAFFNASPASYDFGIMFFMALGAVFLLLTLKHFFQASDAGALAASFLFLLNGFSISNLGSQNAQPYLLAPILLYALLNFSKSPSVLRASFLILSQSMLALITLLPVLITIFIFCYLLTFAWHFQTFKDIYKILKLTGFLFISAILSFCLVAPVYFPIITTLLNGDLVGKYSNRKMLVMDYRGLLDIFSSQHLWFNFNFSVQAENIKPLDIQRFHGGVAQIGLGAILLTTSCLLSRNFWRPINIMLVVIVAYYFYMVLGLPGSDSWFQLPIIQSMNTQYISPLFILSMCFLTALSITNLKSQISLSALLISASLMIFLFWSVINQITGNLVDFQIKNLSILSGWGVLYLGLLIYITQTRNETSPKFIIACIVFIVVAELALQMNTTRPTRYNPYEVDNKTLAFFQENLGMDRMLSISRSKNIPPEWGAAFGMRQISMNTSTMQKNYEKLYLDYLSSDSPLFLILEGGRKLQTRRPVMEVVHKRKGAELLNANFLDMLGVKYIVTTPAKHSLNPDYYKELSVNGYRQIEGLPNPVFENLNPAPFAWITCGAQSGNEAPLDSHEEFYQYAYVAPKQYQTLNLPKHDSCWKASPVTLSNFQNTIVELSVNNAKNGILVTSETWHPGWKVFVNGEEKILLRVNHAFRGVFLEKGNHVIRFEYQASNYKLGLLLMWSTIILLFSANGFSYLRYRLRNKK